MKPENASALIALAGVIVSIVASILSSRWTSRRGITATYVAKLADARLAAYPFLYVILSDFIKHIEGGSAKYMAGEPVTTDDAEQLLRATCAWDSQYALLLSDHGGRASFALRQALIPIAREARLRRPLKERELSVLLTFAQELENALKVELGIYEVEIHENRDFFKSYYEATMGASSGEGPSAPQSRHAHTDGA